MNLSALLPGLVQTNQRAELLAVVLTCLRDPRPLDISTDSDCVCKGFACWQSWVDRGWDGAHADLWNLLVAELRSRLSVVSVSWVKGHATQIDIDRGRSTYEDKLGNDGADKFAVAGASQHQVPSELVVVAKERKQLATKVQRMMVSILQARAEAECTKPDDAVDIDRGSEMGDCMECDEFDIGVDDGHLSVVHDCIELDCTEFVCTDLHFNDDADSGSTILNDES